MLNKTLYQGRLTADPEVKQTQSGVSFIEFTVAWSEKYKEIETKCFLRCKAWRQTAEFIGKYFSKGSEIVIEGKMVTEQWEADGKTQSRIICDVAGVHFCGSKGNSAPQTENVEKTAVKPDLSVIADTDSDLPF